jgi:hypothetical protein
MQKLKKARQILGVSINPYLYKRLKEECSGKNVSAFVERAIAKGLEEKEKVLCGDCLANLAENMPSLRKAEFNRYRKVGRL